MNDILQEETFNFISQDDKAFILAFDDEMAKLGYGFGGDIGSGYCWGRYMLIYTKSGVKSKKVYARIYIRDASVVLRLFFNDIDKHRQYVERTPLYIKEVFTGEHGKCQRCHNDQDGVCRFRKTYTINGQFIEKCNGVTFEFHDPSVDKICDYTALFTEF
jgi:hypothetical protein